MTRTEAQALKDVPGLPSSIAKKVERLLLPRRRRPPRGSGRGGETRGQERRESKGSKSAARRELRAHRMEVDNGECVLCGQPDGKLWPLHLHHVAGRLLERLDTVVMLCESEHEAAHGKLGGEIQVKTLTKLGAFCAANDMPEAARACARKLDKLLEARAVGAVTK